MDNPISFKAYGLTFESEFPLPGLTPGDGDPDVVIRIGTVEDGDGAPVDSSSWIQTQPRETRLFWAGVGRFLIRDANEVVVEPAADVDPQVLQQAVLGPVFCLVVQQRGWYPLHASAVLVGDSVIALAGLSGSGKSSLAAALNNAGYPLVADDVTVIDTVVSPPTVRPGITALKLWPDALEHLGKSADAFPTLDNTTEKRRLDPHQYEVGAVLRRIYLLDEGPESSIRLVSPQHAVLHLLDLCQHRALMHSVVGTVGLIPHAARIAREVALFRLTRRASLSGLFETASMIQEHFGSKD